MILGLLLSLPAHAIDLQFWGVGPTISTMAIPAEHPVSLPANAEQSDGDPKVDHVKGDVHIGAHGVLYPTGAGRIFGIGTLGWGTNGWNRQELVLGWDHALIREKDFQLLLGAGVGAGTEKFPQKNDGDGYLRVDYFPLRGNLSAVLRDKSRAYELGLYGAYHLASGQEWYSGPDADPIDPDEGRDRLIATGAYLELGAQATVYFGDFRTDKQERKGKKK